MPVTNFSRKAFLSIVAALLPLSSFAADKEHDTDGMGDQYTVYIPQDSQKKIATDAASLLRAMGLSDIYVSAKDMKISTSAGSPVAVFIDYIPAKASDLANMRTADVDSVEVYDNPSDIRFGGAARVVNFIMKSYESGSGYGKASLAQSITNNTGIYSIADKTVYKRMTYDIAGGFGYEQNKHTGIIANNNYSFKDYISFSETPDKSKKRNRTGYANLRATYASENVVVANTFNIGIDKNPGSKRMGLEKYRPKIYPDMILDVLTGTTSVAPEWTGNYQFSLPSDFKLVVNPKSSYRHYLDSYEYNTITTPSENIHYSIKEKTWNIGLDAAVSKAFGKQSLGFRISSESTGSNMDIKSPLSDAMKYRNTNVRGSLEGNFEFSKFRLFAIFGMYYDRNS